MENSKGSFPHSHTPSNNNKDYLVYLKPNIFVLTLGSTLDVPRGPVYLIFFSATKM